MRLAVLLAALLVPSGLSFAQQVLPRPGQSGQPSLPQLGPILPRPTQEQPSGPARPGQPTEQQAAASLAPAKPYKPVPIVLPKPIGDPSWAAFRKQLAAVAEKKDRAALSKLVVSRGFFWLKPPEGADGADPKKSGVENLAAALQLDAKDGFGWDALAELAEDDTATPMTERKSVMCSPALPDFNDDDLEKLAKDTGTDPAEWGYPLSSGIEVRAEPKKDAAVIDKLGLHFVRVMPDETQRPGGADEIAFLRIVTPSGKTGYINEEELAPPIADQLCYIREASGQWKITGYIGGEE